MVCGRTDIERSPPIAHRLTTWAGRVRVLVSVAFGALLLIGCNSAVPVAREVTSDGAGFIPSGTRFADVIPVPATALAVDYQWPNSEGTGRFSWRQGDGIRRWDALPAGTSSPSAGTFKIETMFQPGSNLPQVYYDCAWSLVDKSNARVDCGEPIAGVALFTALTSGLLNGRIVKQSADRTIAGHAASCYELTIDEYTKETIVCIDKTSRAILRFSAVRQDGQASSIEAVSINEPADVHVPSDLPPLVRDAEPIPSRPLSHLDLPPSVLFSP